MILDSYKASFHIKKYEPETYHYMKKALDVIFLGEADST